MDRRTDGLEGVMHSTAQTVDLPTEVGRRSPPTLDDLFREHHAFVYRCLRRFGLPEDAAEDAVQEVYIIVQRQLPTYEERGSARSWLFKIARGVASHHHRGTSRARQRMTRVDAPAAPPTPDAEMEWRAAAAAVEDFLAELSEDQQTVFVLADVEGFTAPEIAEVTGVGASTIYSRLRLARRKFEAFVERYEKERDDGTR